MLDVQEPDTAQPESWPNTADEPDHSALQHLPCSFGDGRSSEFAVGGLSAEDAADVEFPLGNLLD